MTGLLVLIPVALGLGLAGLAAFFWSVRDGQYDDMDGAALRVLLDDSDGPPGTGAIRLDPEPSPSAAGDHRAI